MTNRMGQLGRLASQTAARKLGQILGLLVIPIIGLWLMHFFNAKAEIDGLSGEPAVRAWWNVVLLTLGVVSAGIAVFNNQCRHFKFESGTRDKSQRTEVCAR
jgi:MFS family permease